MPLTNIAINNLKAGEKPVRRADRQGLYIQANPCGSKIFYWKFRYQGKERRLSMGHYPEVSLEQARSRHAEGRAMLTAGIDPSLERRREKLQRAKSAATTFKDAANKHIEARIEAGELADATIKKTKWLLELLKPLHDMPVAEVKSADVHAALERIAAHGRLHTVRNARSLVSRIYRYSVANLLADHDPAEVLKDAFRKPKTKHHAAITEPSKVGELLHAIECSNAHRITQLAMQLLPHVFVRPGELRKAVWSEFDLANAVWRIPGERMKMRRPHTVPLSRQAVRYLGELDALTGPSGYIFPTFYTSRRPLSENTLNQALRRLGYSKGQMTSHGWRTTASTLLNESRNFSPDAIERSLAHRDKNSVRSVYNYADFWEERVRLYQWWSDYLDQLRDGVPIAPTDFVKQAGNCTEDSSVVSFVAERSKRLG